jgi:TRAP-type C4-dicarboxylate transport system substrate-binding protein
VVVNTRALKRLPKAQQDALMGAAQGAEPRGWAMSKQRERDGDETLAKNGMTLHEPSAAMKAAFEKVGAQMAKEWEDKAGADGQAILKAYKK